MYQYRITPYGIQVTFASFSSAACTNACSTKIYACKVMIMLITFTKNVQIII